MNERGGEWTYLKQGGNERIPERESTSTQGKRKKEGYMGTIENKATFRGERPIHINFSWYVVKLLLL